MRRQVVLLVEDNFDNREIYRTILEVGGFEVLTAENGQEGVRIAREHSPDLVLMDLSMPVMDGWEAMRRLRAEAATAQIPVCALSAHILTEQTLSRAEAAGFRCYLTKPIEPKQVLEVVRSLVEGRHADVEETASLNVGVLSRSRAVHSTLAAAGR